MTPPLLDIRDVSVVRGRHRLLNDLTLSIPQGRHTAILGPNGSGKSSLVRLITRQFYPTGGHGMATIFGQDRWDVFELRKLLGVVSPALQTDYQSEDAPEVFDAVVSGFFATRGVWRREIAPDMRRAAEDAMTQARVSHLAGRSMAGLSTGEARRVLIARALVHGPRALLLDEPCTGLDPAARHRFLEDLQAVARSGVTLILITHHIEEILPEIDHLVLLSGGRLLREGAKADLLTAATLSDLFDAPLHVEVRDGWFSLRRC